jgi:hypothetical protein
VGSRGPWRTGGAARHGGGRDGDGAHDARSGAGWTVSTNNERNLFLGNNPYTPDYKTSHLGQRPRGELGLETRRYLESFYARGDSRSAMQHAAIAYMVEHPIQTTRRTLNRAMSFWGFDYLASREIQKWAGADQERGATRRAAYGAASLFLLGVEAASYLAVATLALATLFAIPGVPLAADGIPGVPIAAAGTPGAGTPGVAIPGRPAWRSWLVALALGYEVPYAVAFSGGTYHFPVIPLLIPLAAVAAQRPVRTWRYLRESRRAWVALGVFAVVQAEYAYYAVALSG